MTKYEIRSKIKEINHQLKSDYKTQASLLITKKLMAVKAFQNADSVFIYLSDYGEPFTDELITYALCCGKKVYAPKITAKGEMRAVRLYNLKEVTVNRYGIREPVENDDILSNNNKNTVAVVPCISVTKTGVRLGHGGGYYDRFLSAHPLFTVCLCFEKTLSEVLPINKHDVFMDTVITECGVYECSAKN